MALWLTRQDVEKVLTMPEAIDVVEEAFRRLATGDVLMPQRVGIGVEKYGGWGAVMPAYVGGTVDGLGLKVVTLYRDNPARAKLPAILATIVLLDPHTGALQAVMDGAYITAMRTGAVSGVATRYMARPDASRVAVFGAGVQARTQLQAMAAVRPVRQVWVVDPLPGAAERFARDLGAQLGISVEPCAEAQTAIESADIIVTASTAQQPILNGDWLKPGQHVNGIGSHAPKARELDTRTVQRARIVADQRSACLAEAGDIMIPIQEGAITQDHLYAELGEVVTGAKPGRLEPEDITLFKSVGLAIQDVSVAMHVWKKALAAGIGQELAQ